MCGRYALAFRPREIRQRLQEYQMPSQDDLDDDASRQSYNFAPGYYGLVYRADVPDHGAGGRSSQQEEAHEQSSLSGISEEQPSNSERSGVEVAPEGNISVEKENDQDDTTPRSGQYKIQAMKWGLVPFWTKRNPDYGTTMKTINCRDDSLATPGGMWNTMKQKKRCIVLAQGFYEWLKKNGGKEKIPHYVKRTDGQLMCFAGLWDCVQYEDSPTKLYTYTIITTDSNKQLSFLHDRMPVILEPGSPDLFTWLDSSISTWTKELQSLLKPFKGELECYPVVKDVGKVGNNSPTFIIPVDSADNKQNIANFFGNQKRKAESKAEKEEASKEQQDVEEMGEELQEDPTESRRTIDDPDDDAENNAPKPVPAVKGATGTKRPHADDDEPTPSSPPPAAKKAATTALGKRSRDATSNNTALKASSPTKAGGNGSKKITNFFREVT